MRIQLRIPPHVWEQLADVALKEHRPPKHQAELLLWQAIDQAAQAQRDERLGERQNHDDVELATAGV